MAPSPDSPAPDTAGSDQHREGAGADASPLTYARAGVDIKAGEEAVERYKASAAATARPGVMGSIGGFGALFDLKAAGWNDPVLVAGTDGVGTKLRIALETGVLDTVGVDLVAMVVNDLLCQGAEPLFFLDYLATGALDPQKAAEVVRGIARGCAEAGCALIGGETAEMPGFYAAGDLDLAGFGVGAVERAHILPRPQSMRAGDVLIGLPSSGVHSNGFSLVRAVTARTGLSWGAPCPWDEQRSLGAALLEPTRIYVKPLLPLIRDGLIKGMAHITGGGIVGNVPRMLPDALRAEIDWAGWTRPPVFNWLQEQGATPEADMRATFNLGVGMTLCVDAPDAPAVMSRLAQSGSEPLVIGQTRPAA